MAILRPAAPELDETVPQVCSGQSVDPACQLLFLGRIKDVLKVGGENVSPLEVEALLSTHPAVHLAQVVGRPSERYGEEPVAFVELIPGGQATAAELIAFCAANVASYKVPREIRFVADWPMSASKIQKFRLRELLLECHKASMRAPNDVRCHPSGCMARADDPVRPVWRLA